MGLYPDTQTSTNTKKTHVSALLVSRKTGLGYARTTSQCSSEASHFEIFSFCKQGGFFFRNLGFRKNGIGIIWLFNDRNIEALTSVQQKVLRNKFHKIYTVWFLWETFAHYNVQNRVSCFAGFFFNQEKCAKFLKRWPFWEQRKIYNRKNFGLFWKISSNF